MLRQKRRVLVGRQNASVIGSSRPRKALAVADVEFVYVLDDGQDEYYNEENYSNYHDIDIDEDDQREEISNEEPYHGVDESSLSNVQNFIRATAKKWREVGNNSNRRGGGTSRSIFNRNKKKASDLLHSSEALQAIGTFFKNVSLTDSSLATVDLPTNVLESESVQGSNDIFEEILLGHESIVKETVIKSTVVKRKRRSKFNMREAIQHLLENEANFTRNCAIEAKKDLEHWQVIQATAILRFLHL